MSSEEDDGNDVIRRKRSHGDASSSIGSARRLKCHPEKLIESSRRVSELGTAYVDDGASISRTHAAIVSSKAFLLEIEHKNRRIGEGSAPAVGQVGLIRGERGWSPPQQRSALVGEDDRPASILRSTRFSVTPTTCLHNVASGPDESGDVL